MSSTENKALGICDFLLEGFIAFALELVCVVCPELGVTLLVQEKNLFP